MDSVSNLKYYDDMDENSKSRFDEVFRLLGMTRQQVRDSLVRKAEQQKQNGQVKLDLTK